jgi:hypothetical protein
MHGFLQWNSYRASRPPTMKHSYGPSISSFLSGCAFHLTWYRTFPLMFLLDNIAWVSHSSLPSMSSDSSMIFSRSGGGLVLLLYGSSRDTWKVLWIFHFRGSYSHIAVGDTTFSISKDHAVCDPACPLVFSFGFCYHPI